MDRGITSACAEKRVSTSPAKPQHRNYLRMRGEELLEEHQITLRAELPPHARRRVCIVENIAYKRGITSACAEKRTEPKNIINIRRNYLRMRGEEQNWVRCRCAQGELPPHARRRARFSPVTSITLGITSACAEKRGPLDDLITNRRNYLRMRGEENWAAFPRGLKKELPPHARRRAKAGLDSAAGEGITSACAEKSRSPR